MPTPLAFEARCRTGPNADQDTGPVPVAHRCAISDRVKSRPVPPAIRASLISPGLQLSRTCSPGTCESNSRCHPTISYSCMFFLSVGLTRRLNPGHQPFAGGVGPNYFGPCPGLKMRVSASDRLVHIGLKHIHRAFNCVDVLHFAPRIYLIFVVAG